MLTRRRVARTTRGLDSFACNACAGARGKKWAVRCGRVMACGQKSRSPPMSSPRAWRSWSASRTAFCVRSSTGCPAAILRRRRGGMAAACFSMRSGRNFAWRRDLSDKELLVLQGVFDDLTDDAIAPRLGITKNTVRTHFKRLHDKFRISTRAALIVLVLEEMVGTPHPLYTEPGTAQGRAARLTRVFPRRYVERVAFGDCVDWPARQGAGHA